MLRIVIFFISLFAPLSCLDNGVARTPPMGWMSWERFRCITDCKEYPNECISEQLFKDMADVMASDGYADVGYEYIIIDDCWLANERDENGKLQPDPDRFPSGIKALADYVHKSGLKFGIYEDYGTHTCAGYPGILGHLETDAQTFAEWEVDYIKLDGCYSELKDMPEGYAEFGQYLNKTGRPIVYSCSYPAYEETSHIPPDYEKLAKNCNLWRNYGDIQDSWSSVSSIINWYSANQHRFAPYAGPGHWNDPDMLIIGNFGLSYEQSKAQMAIWAILASPLLMSADLRTIRPEYKAILQNKDVIAINQDPLGIQGERLFTRDSIDVFIKKVTPIVNGNLSYAIAFLSKRTDGTPKRITINRNEIGITNKETYLVRNIYDGSIFILRENGTISAKVNPTGVVLLKAEPVTNHLFR